MAVRILSGLFGESLIWNWKLMLTVEIGFCDHEGLIAHSGYLYFDFMNLKKVQNRIRLKAVPRHIVDRDPYYRGL